MAFTDEQLEKLRKDLPRGSAKKLAIKFSLKEGSVYNILSGSSNNEEVILEAFEMAKLHQEKLANLKSALA